jgi:hypothetical protein
VTAKQKIIHQESKSRSPGLSAHTLRLSINILNHEKAMRNVMMGKKIVLHVSSKTLREKNSHL